jgi:hypothetical protein
MPNSLPFEQLHQLFGSEFTTIGKSLEDLSSLYQQLPVAGNVKKRFIDNSLKNKSGWYACLVNTNIDVLLLPEYLESRQSRNILIKKETDQYFKSIENFDRLSCQSNICLYENILVEGDVPQSSGLDLFSNHVKETGKCPEGLQKLFGTWNLSLKGYGNLETIIFSFYEWHMSNQFSFSAQRQNVLWLNYQLWKQFGQMTFSLGLENYLFHHWQKESRDPKNAVKDILSFLKTEIEKNEAALNTLFRTEIGFEHLKPQQKLISGYLFSCGFKVQLPVKVQQSPFVKILLSKGYIELNDLEQKTETVKNIFEELHDLEIIFMAHEDEERYICLNPSYREHKGRLSKYSNIEFVKRELQWEEFISQSLTKVIIPKVIETVPEPVKETVSKRQKAFFG